MASLSFADLKNYVDRTDGTTEGRRAAAYANLDGTDTVKIHCTHSNLMRKMFEIKFDLHTTIGEVKYRLNKHCGSTVDDMQLILKDNDEPICRLDDDTKMLGFYSVVSGMEIHIIDNNPYSISSGGALENTALVEKYVMPDEVYDKRKGTLRDYKRERQKKDPNFTFASGMRKNKENQGEHKVEAPPGAEESAHCIIGERCQVTPGARRGVVAYVGEVPSISKGFFVGVQLDEPAGRHDGTCPKGTRYFECAVKYGIFTRPKNVECGDFPEEDLFEDSDEEL